VHVCTCLDAAALGKMLSLCAYHPSALLKTSSALMGCSVEKSCKLDVMRYAGFEMITLLRVSVLTAFWEWHCCDFAVQTCQILASNP